MCLQPTHSCQIEWHTDGYRQGISHSFSLLVGVALSAMEEDFAGNLSVWPSSHFLLHHCREEPHGDIDVDLLRRCIQSNHSLSKLCGLQPSEDISSEEPSEGWHDNLKKRPALPSLGPPKQLYAQPGVSAAALAHHI